MNVILLDVEKEAFRKQGDCKPGVSKRSTVALLCYFFSSVVLFPFFDNPEENVLFRVLFLLN